MFFAALYHTILWFLSSAAFAFAHGIENCEPRLHQQTCMRKGGWVYRLHCAQANAAENFPLFAAAILMAMQKDVDINIQVSYALMFVIFRLLHAVFYVGNLTTMRSFVFLCSLHCAMWLMANAVFGKGYDDSIRTSIASITKPISGLFK